jgi:hypothetical protein
LFTLVVSAVEASAERVRASLDAHGSVDLVPPLRGPHNTCIAAARCLEHYGRLVEVKCALDAALCELDGVAARGETPSRVIVRRRLDRLSIALHEFGQSAIRIRSIPAFRGGTDSRTPWDAWLLGLHNGKSYEFLVPAVVNLYPLACPVVGSLKWEPAATIAYPTAPPSPAIARNLRMAEQPPKIAPYRDYPFEVVVSRAVEEEIRYQASTLLKYDGLDLEDRHALAAAIASTPVQRDRLDAVGCALAETIQRRFGLSRLSN